MNDVSWYCLHLTDWFLCRQEETLPEMECEFIAWPCQALFPALTCDLRVLERYWPTRILELGLSAIISFHFIFTSNLKFNFLVAPVGPKLFQFQDSHRVVLCGDVQTLSIRHDVVNVKALMPGLILAIRRVVRLKVNSSSFLLSSVISTQDYRYMTNRNAM